MKILLAEDDEALRGITRFHLQKAGYETVEAESGAVAWEIFQRAPFTLVITDWMMPDMTGPELVAKIRGANLPDYTYIIILTALDDRPSLMTGEKAGADDYLIKPLDAPELLARLKIGERMVKFKTKQMRDAKPPR